MPWLGQVWYRGTPRNPARLPPPSTNQVTRIARGALLSSYFGMNGLGKTRGLFWRIVKVQIRFIHLQLDQTEGPGAGEHAIDARVERHHGQAGHHCMRLCDDRGRWLHPG